jgi:hypothetical protein
MMTLRSLFVLGLALSLMGSAEAAKAKAKKKKEHAHHGVVEVVKLEKDKESEGKEVGSITIKVHAKKKKGVEAKEEKFRLADYTKVERVAGKKGSKTAETVTLSSLKPGEHVHILAKDGEAKEIKIVAKKKGKKKKANA